MNSDLAPLPLASLRKILIKNNPIAVALSGGVDSRFLCLAAMRSGCDVLALHVTGPHITREESAYARAWALSVGLPFQELSVNPLRLPDVANNTKHRCYTCKQEIFSAIRKWLTAESQEKRVLCDGNNIDDLKTFRPGLAACREAGVLSPLALAGFCKNEIRKQGKLLGLENPDQAARPCLLTRFPYDYTITEKDLLTIASAERDIQSFFETMCAPAPDFRLRFTPDPQLHLSFMPEKAEPALREIFMREIFKSNGIDHCEIRILPKLSGFYDAGDKQT